MGGNLVYLEFRDMRDGEGMSEKWVRVSRALSDLVNKPTFGFMNRLLHYKTCLIRSRCDANSSKLWCNRARDEAPHPGGLGETQPT